MFQTITTTISSNWIEVANATAALQPTAIALDLNMTTIFSNASNIDDATNKTEYHICHPKNPEFNCSIDDFLSFYLGAKQMPLETAIWVSVKLK